jgi:hypothetical protein
MIFTGHLFVRELVLGTTNLKLIPSHLKTLLMSTLFSIQVLHLPSYHHLTGLLSSINWFKMHNWSSGTQNKECFSYHAVNLTSYPTYTSCLITAGYKCSLLTLFLTHHSKEISPYAPFQLWKMILIISLWVFLFCEVITLFMICKMD